MAAYGGAMSDFAVLYLQACRLNPPPLVLAEFLASTPCVCISFL